MTGAMNILASSGGGGYSANGVTFDAVNDSLTKTTDLTGNADNTTGFISLWYRPNTNVSGDYQWYEVGNSGSQRFRIKHNGSSVDSIVARNAAGTQILSANPSTNLMNDQNWHSIIFGFDLSDSAKRFLFVDDVLDSSANYSIYTNDSIDWTSPDHSIGARFNGDQKADGDMADVWFDNSYIDALTEATRRKFIDSNGKPVNLGADGSFPTGSPPLIYLSGATANWHTNKGTGGGFTENGALTTASTSPSD